MELNKKISEEELKGASTLNGNNFDIVLLREINKLAYKLDKTTDMLCSKYEANDCEGCPLNIEGGICDSVKRLSNLSNGSVKAYTKYEEFLVPYIDTILTNFYDVEVVYLLKEREGLYSNNEYSLAIFTRDIEDVKALLDRHLHLQFCINNALILEDIHIGINMYELNEIGNLEEELSYGNYVVIKRIER